MTAELKEDIFEHLEKEASDIEFHLRTFSKIATIKCQHSVILTIERINNSDRGKYLLRADAAIPYPVHIDGADGFPRYYFKFENLISEAIAWMKARNIQPLFFRLEKQG